MELKLVTMVALENSEPAVQNNFKSRIENIMNCYHHVVNLYKNSQVKLPSLSSLLQLVKEEGELDPCFFLREEKNTDKSVILLTISLLEQAIERLSKKPRVTGERNVEDRAAGQEGGVGIFDSLNSDIISYTRRFYHPNPEHWDIIEKTITALKAQKIELKKRLIPN